MLKERQAKPAARHFSLGDQAKALAVVLCEEFGVPFTFYECTTGTEVRTSDRGEGRLRRAGLDLARVAALTTEGRAHVTSLADGTYQLAVVLYEADTPVLVAVGEMTPLARSAADAAREQLRLQKWLQSVADRLRLSGQLSGRRQSEESQNSQATIAWEAMLTLDQLVRRLRFHKDPSRTRTRILESVFGLLGIQTLIWVPERLDSAVRFQGEECLAPADCRRLASFVAQGADSRGAGPILCNDVQEKNWSTGFPNVHNVMAFPVADQGPAAWVIAINKKGSGVNGAGGVAPFRKSDAALLTPFVGLLELHRRSSERYHDLKDLLVGLTRSLTSALDAKDSYTFGHSERVARIAVELGRELHLQEDELGDIYLAGLLHDVGKIGIHDAVLRKPGPLTAEEFEHIKQHVTIGYKILSDLRPIRNLLPGVLYHHERYDGSGYPDGLAGESIPFLARILAVADAYDAMSTARPYRDAMPCRRVEEILLEGAGIQWDAQVVEAFQHCRQKIHAIRQRGVGESLCHALDGALRADDGSTECGMDLGANQA